MEFRREKRRKLILMRLELLENLNGGWGMKSHTFPKRENKSLYPIHLASNLVYNERTEDTKDDCYFI